MGTYHTIAWRGALCTVCLEADALYAFEEFGEAIGMNEGSATSILVCTPTNHLQFKVSQITILTKEVSVFVHFF